MATVGLDKEKLNDHDSSVSNKSIPDGHTKEDKMNHGASKVDTYKYVPIDHNVEIRILKILRGSPYDRLQCKLFPIRLPGLAGQGSASKKKSFKYCALSYCWGDADELSKNEIAIYQHDCSLPPRTFWIRDNLKNALLRLRKQDEDVNVWADAICIDQGNFTEKMAQVLRMHEVFSQAENVCIWLGEGGEFTSGDMEGFNVLRTILDLYGVDEMTRNPKSSARKWASVIDLMKNRWFSRRWVLQELALSKTAIIRLGNAELPYQDFVEAIAVFMERYDEIKRTSLDPEGYHASTDVRMLSANTVIQVTESGFLKSQKGEIEQRMFPLEVLVTSLLLRFEATDPRDIIFAVLTLANDSMNDSSEGFERDPRIVPDYSKTILDVYVGFMSFCIEKSQSLNIICRSWAQLPKKVSWHAVENMPSWIPLNLKSTFGELQEKGNLLNSHMNYESFVGTLESKGRQYNSSAGLRAWAKFGTLEEPRTLSRRASFPFEFPKSLPSVEEWAITRNNTEVSLLVKPGHDSAGLHGEPTRKYDGTLRVRGFIVGCISQVSERVTEKGIITAEALEMGGWQRKDNSPDVPDQLWRTLVANRGPNGTMAPSYYRRACLECLRHTGRVGDLDIDNLKKMCQPSLPSLVIHYLERAQQVVRGRRFFITDENALPEEKMKWGERLFGLGSADIRPGDLVCVLFGCTVPVVLRNIRSGLGTSFEFIGESYVHGIMEGQALRSRTPMYPYGGKKSWVSTFKLK